MPKRDQEAPETQESKKYRIAGFDAPLSRDKMRTFIPRSIYRVTSDDIEEYWKELEGTY